MRLGHLKCVAISMAHLFRQSCSFRCPLTSQTVAHSKGPMESKLDCIVCIILYVEESALPEIDGTDIVKVDEDAIGLKTAFAV